MIKFLKPITREQASEKLERLLDKGLPAPITTDMAEKSEITHDEIVTMVDGYIDNFIDNHIHHYRQLLQGWVYTILQQEYGYSGKKELMTKPQTVFRKGDNKTDCPPSDDWITDIGFIKR